MRYPDEHLDEGLGETRLIALAHGTEHDEIGEARRDRQLIAKAALSLAQGERDLVRPHRMADAFDRGGAASGRDGRLDALGRFVAGVLRRLDDLLDDNARNAVGEERQRLAQIGAHEEGDDMGVEGARGGDRIGEHSRIARSAGHGSKDLGDRQGVSLPQTRSIIDPSTDAGKSSRLDLSA